MGDDVKRERARELALHIMTDKNIAEQIASIILAACAEEEQRRMDYNLHAQTPLTSPAQSSDYHGLGAAGSGLQPPYGRAK